MEAELPANSFWQFSTENVTFYVRGYTRYGDPNKTPLGGHTHPYKKYVGSAATIGVPALGAGSPPGLVVTFSKII